MRKSGVVLREVGTTNRTHPHDYASALSAQTGVLLKVHTSNYRVIGFTSEVGLEELVAIGNEQRVPVMEDLGAGALIDLSHYGLPKEPVVAERIAKGAAVVTFSGDKLLGGPQAGLIVGSQRMGRQDQKEPLKRALRLGKLTPGGLECHPAAIPSFTGFAARPAHPALADSTGKRDGGPGRPSGSACTADAGQRILCECRKRTGPRSAVGPLPEEELPSKVIAIRHTELSAERIAQRFRKANPPILGRIHNGTFLLDLRGIFDPHDLVP